MEWTIRLEARTGWGEVTSYEIGCLRRGLHDLSSEGIGLNLAEAKIVVMIDEVHLRAVPGLNSRNVDVTVGKVETAGRPSRRFALAPMGSAQPAQAITAALLDQGWQPGRAVTVISDGEPALPKPPADCADCRW